MRRPASVVTLVAAVVAAAVVAPAQPANPLVGYLSARSPEDTAHLVAAFRRGLAEGGFVEGNNVTIEYRWARGQYERLPALAGELARRRPAVLVTTGGESAALAAKAAMPTIPIVFTVGGDPIKLGLVASYNRPGGNATGINILTTTLEGKRIGLLHELVPGASMLGLLANPGNPAIENQLRDAQQAAKALGVRLEVLKASTDRELETAFRTVAQQRIAALAVASAPFFDTRREKLIALAARHAVPTMYHFREYVEAGGLISYGIDVADGYRQAGVYAARILRGAKPADLPVMQPTKFELVINLKTARALGLTIPPPLLLSADHVIQ